MLTRVYGVTFPNQKELDEYLLLLEEAKKRDHRKLGKDLGIYTMSDDVGPGLPLWMPNGTIIIEELERLAKETEEAAGYKRVVTPHIAKESMYITSGHLPYYQDSMFPPMELDGTKYYLKAMNCPHHHKIFDAEPKSYKDMPLRLAEYGTCYRYEQSGELFGLMRVRCLHMNDAHIYCTKAQFAQEFRAVNEMYLKYFNIFGIDKYVMRLSLHDPAKLGQKYINEPELWKETEDMVRQVLIETGTPFVEVQDEGAFYGPKIDIQMKDARGKENTAFTVQYDFCMPDRFNLTYIASDGTEKRPVVVHRSSIGAIERVIAFLIEHYAGAFPVWLAPVQVKVLPIGEGHQQYAEEVAVELRTHDIRVEVSAESESLGKRIRTAKTEKVPYLIVVGDKEVEAHTVSLEHRTDGQLGSKTITEALVIITQAITEKK